MQDIQLVSLWNAPKGKDTQVFFHEHNCYELVYYSYGDGNTVIGETSYHFNEGNFAIIPPSVRHDEVHFEDGHVICLGFQGGNLDFPVFSKDTHGIVSKILKELLQEIRYQAYGYRDMISVKLNELCLHILRCGHIATDEKNLEYAVNYLTENYWEKIVLADCAKQLNISYDYFQHKFKEKTGYSPRQFLLARRLQASKQLLENSRLSCTEIAYRCGFSTSAQFSLLFKREVGMSPLQYQKKYRLA